MGIDKTSNGSKLQERLEYIADSFKKVGVYSSTSLIKTKHFAEGVNLGNQALSSAFFKPNIIFLTLSENNEPSQEFPAIIEEAGYLGLGVILYIPHKNAILGQQQKINFWIEDRNGNWDIEKDTGNIDLPLLTAYKLKLNWNAEITLIANIKDEKDTHHANRFLKSVTELARLPISNTLVTSGPFVERVQKGPYADLNIFALSDDISLDYCKEMIGHTNTSCLFIKDSGHENILA